MGRNIGGGREEKAIISIGDIVGNRVYFHHQRVLALPVVHLVGRISAIIINEKPAEILTWRNFLPAGNKDALFSCQHPLVKANASS